MISKFEKSIVILIIFLFAEDSFSQSWMQLNTTGNITARANASAVYDEVNNRMIVFGGLTATGVSNETWSLNLNTNEWSLITPSSLATPSPRYTHICMYDSLLNRMIAWSGNGSALYNDVWAFNLNDSTWEELFPDGNVSGAPLKRYGTATAFDPVRRNLVSFAGFTTSGRFDDTWVFDVDTHVWSDQSNSIFPLLRCLTSQSFASDRREMIVYGGQSTGNLDDIWTLNSDTYIWTNHTPAQRPAGRHFTSNVYCGNGNVVIFGGNALNQGNTSGALDDLWAFNLDSEKWDSLPQGTVKPTPRFGHTYIYIASQDKMIIFGGQGVSSLNAETWVYSGIASFLNSIDEPKKSVANLNCYPNPSTENLTISFRVSEKSQFKIKLFDQCGKNIGIISEQEYEPGNHKIYFDTKNLKQGFYICTLESDYFTDAVRILKQ